MIGDLTELRNRLEQEKGKCAQLEKQCVQQEDELDHLEAREEDLEKAQTIIQVVAQQTQSQLEYHISELATLAMEAVFPDPYKLDLAFELRRNKTEADITFVRNKEKVDPLSASGGGVVDIAALAMRVSLWSLRRPRTRNVLILDEPLRFLSRELQLKASLMLKQISKKLGLQLIIVTHEPNLLKHADRIFEVSKSGEKTKVQLGEMEEEE